MINKIVTTGEALAIFRTSPEQPLWQTAQATIATGGAEANVAMAVARAGVRSAWYGRVGDDELGRRDVRELRAEGVEVHATVDRHAPTGLLVKSLHPGGRTSVSYYRTSSAGSRMAAVDVDKIALDDSTLVHLCGITPGLSPAAHQAIFRLVDRIDEAGASLSFDINHRERVWRDASPRAIYQELAARADIVFASRSEIALIDDSVPASSLEDAAAELADRGYRHVVLTDGAAGAIASVDGVTTRVPAVPVSVVDSVGAGDAFVAGYLSEFAKGHSTARALEFGAVLGAAACRHPGDWEGAADWVDLVGDQADPVSR